MTPIELAEHAKALLESQAFKVCMSDLRKDLVSQLEQANTGDVEAQHDCVLMLKLLIQIQMKLAKYTDTIAVDRARDREREWMTRAKESITDLMLPRRIR